MSKSKKEKINFYNMFWLFILASVFGWIVEGIYTYIRRGQLINHSAVVIGPFNMAYGICACFLTAILYKYRDDSKIKIFLISFIGGSVIEYLMSLGMEVFLGFTAWNYSRYFLNINGRICLLYSVFWGILGIVWIKICFPFIVKFLTKINQFKYNGFLVKFLIAFLIFDILLTIGAIERARSFEKGIAPANKIEVFLDNTFNKDYLTNMFNNNWGD